MSGINSLSFNTELVVWGKVGVISTNLLIPSSRLFSLQSALE